ncbi:MAG: glycosyltransferase [Phycisphaerae bacterium]|nr:glycosyltransferase [Phycisphaerae bacterium]
MDICPVENLTGDYCSFIATHVTPNFCKNVCKGNWQDHLDKSMFELLPKEKLPLLNAIHQCASCQYRKTGQCHITPCDVRNGEIDKCPRGLWDNNQQYQLPSNPDNEKVSIIITARNEHYLNPTTKSLLKMASGDIEIVIVLDGPPTRPPIKHRQVKIIRHKKPQGRRPSIDEAVQAATGKYLLHLDGHVKPEVKGYDAILKRGCIDNKTMVVCNLTRLEPRSWRAVGKPMGHKYIAYNLKDCWSNKRPQHEFEQTICGNGMGWFLPRDYYLALGGCDKTLAPTWGSFGVEWALKVWLSDPDGRGPGQVLLSRDCRIGHLWQKRIPYKAPGARQTRSSLRKWIDGKGENQVRDIKYLQDNLGHLFPVNYDPSHKPLIIAQQENSICW